MNNKRNKEPSLRATLDNALDLLSEDVGSLWAVAQQHASIPILERPPSPLTFLRDYVHPSRPCIIRNCIPAQDREVGGDERPLILTLDDLVDICDENKRAGPCTSSSDEGDIMLTCDVTPDGHGDCVRSVVSLDLNHLGEPASGDVCQARRATNDAETISRRTSDGTRGVEAKQLQLQRR